MAVPARNGPIVHMYVCMCVSCLLCPACFARASTPVQVSNPSREYQASCMPMAVSQMTGLVAEAGGRASVRSYLQGFHLVRCSVVCPHVQAVEGNHMRIRAVRSGDTALAGHDCQLHRRPSPSVYTLLQVALRDAFGIGLHSFSACRPL